MLPHNCRKINSDGHLPRRDRFRAAAARRYRSPSGAAVSRQLLRLGGGRGDLALGRAHRRRTARPRSASTCLLSLALRFLPMLTCLRTRRFQVLRVFEAMARRFYHSRAAETTPSIDPRLRSTVLSCSRCPTVTWKVFTARPSSVVRHLAWEMLTPCSVNDLEMAASRPGRSVQVTWTATGRSVFDSLVPRDVDAARRIEVERLRAVARVDDDAVSAADEADDRVARHGRAALGELHQDVRLALHRDAARSTAWRRARAAGERLGRRRGAGVSGLPRDCIDQHGVGRVGRG